MRQAILEALQSAENLETISMLGAIAFSLLAAGISLQNVVRLKRAERELLRSLATRRPELDDLRRALQDSKDRAALERAKAIFIHSSDDLAQPWRSRIQGVLEQPSAEGQEVYIRKLLASKGWESTTLAP